MTIRELIVKVIDDHQGIKATQLIAEVMSHLDEVNTDDFEYVLSDMIKNGEIIEVEYTLPKMDYRVKSWLLPKDSVVVISNKVN